MYHIIIFLYCSRPRKKKKPDDLTPLECISFLHEKYIHPICEQSGLPGLTYIAGPMVEACVEADPPHKVGVLAAVCYPESGSNGLKTSGRCPTCREEYDIKEVLHQTCKLIMSILVYHAKAISLGSRSLFCTYVELYEL